MTGITGTNWSKVRAEYVNGKSQAKLAKKYHVSRNIIARHCAAEGWTEERKRARANIQEKVTQITASAVAETAIVEEQFKREGLETLLRLLREFNNLKCTEHRDIKKVSVDILRLKDITSAYKDLIDDKKDNDGDTEPVQIIWGR